MSRRTFQWNVPRPMLGRLPARSWRPGAAILSGLLLAAAFPPVGAAAAAWFALVPLLLVARFTDFRAAWRLGWLSGFVFWVLTLVWLRRLADFETPWLAVVCGWVALAAACAVYTGCFCATAALLWARAREGGAPVRWPGLRNLGIMFAVALIWVGFEYLRSTLFTGFAWNALGVSQYRNLALIQVAEWGGVYAVSAVVVLLNAALALTGLDLARPFARAGGRPRHLHGELLAALLIVGVTLGFGLRRLHELRRGEGETALTRLRAAAVQGNIPQDEKWSDAFAAETCQRLMDLTERAAQAQPGLIIWPETSVPWPLRLNRGELDFLNELAAGTAPLLVGAIEVDDTRQPPRMFNSAFLFGADGGVAGVYRKQHLVPFGEYIPLGGVLPFLEQFAPLGYSCTAGATGTVLRVGPAQIPFATLICFEDSMAPLARRAVANGARLLINQSNDAWFQGTCAAVQHLSQCIFRCVENRVPAIRCANFGVSGVIDRTGALDEATRASLAKGAAADIVFRVDEVRVPRADFQPTVYTRFGDLPFAVPCAVLAVAGLGLGWWRARGGAVAAGR